MNGRFQRLTGLILAVVMVLICITPAAAQERRPDRNRHRHAVAAHHDYAPVVVHGKQFFFREGRFYHREPRGYVAVRAPFGAIVLALPVGFGTVAFGPTTYYSYGGTFYSRVPQGYMVVEPPKEVIVREEPAQDFDVHDRVRVTAELLNVRQGPGVDFPVMRRAHRNTVLEICGTAPGWLYVEFNYGQYGWVMEKFTAPMASAPRG